MTMTRVELHIDELVLHGFPAADRDAIGDALRERLARLVTAGTPGWTDRGQVEAPRFAPAGTPGQTGARIADAVYAGLSQ